MFLSLSPDAPTPAASGFFAQVSPNLLGAAALSSWRLQLALSGDYRGSVAAGHLFFEAAEARVVLPPFGFARVQLSGSGGRFDATRDANARFLFAAGASELRLQVVDSLRILASYRVEMRFYPGRPATEGDRDLLQMAALRAPFRPHPFFELAPFGSYLHLAGRGDAGAGAVLVRARTGLDATVIWSRVTASVAGWVGRVDLSNVVNAWQTGAAIEMRVRVSPLVDAVATFDWDSGTPPSGTGPRDFSRRLLLLGLLAHDTTRPALSPARRAADLRPRLQGRHVHFRLRLARAAQVRIIGSWDDWAGQGRLVPSADESNLWELTLELPPGVHRYHFVVDDQPVRPPDASRYAPDGFGGQDGVVEVQGSVSDVEAARTVNTVEGSR